MIWIANRRDASIWGGKIINFIIFHPSIVAPLDAANCTRSHAYIMNFWIGYCQIIIVCNDDIAIIVSGTGNI